MIIPPNILSKDKGSPTGTGQDNVFSIPFSVTFVELYLDPIPSFLAFGDEITVKAHLDPMVTHDNVGWGYDPQSFLLIGKLD